jgi:A/G-specific adenine glycosylase
VLQCVPKSPDCSICILTKVALLAKKVDQLPVKSKTMKVRNRYFNYLVLEDETGIQLSRKERMKFGTTYTSFFDRDGEGRRF